MKNDECRVKDEKRKVEKRKISQATYGNSCVIFMQDNEFTWRKPLSKKQSAGMQAP